MFEISGVMLNLVALLRAQDLALDRGRGLMPDIGLMSPDMGLPEIEAKATGTVIIGALMLVHVRTEMTVLTEAQTELTQMRERMRQS